MMALPSARAKFLCPTCRDCGWVCENHPDVAWAGMTGDAACCGGAGSPCPDCSLYHLSAAAPVMFDALTKLRKALDLVDPSRPLQYADAMDLMRKCADAALAAAQPKEINP